MAHLHESGVTSLVSASAKTSGAGTLGTTVYAGEWFQVHPHISVRDLAFTCKLTGSSAGSTATATVSIQGSNDGTNALSTDLLTFSAVSLTTDTVVVSGVIPSSFAGHYQYLRANVTSFTTTTAGSSEIGGQVNVLVGAMRRAF